MGWFKRQPDLPEPVVNRRGNRRRTQQRNEEHQSVAPPRLRSELQVSIIAIGERDQRKQHYRDQNPGDQARSPEKNFVHWRRISGQHRQH